MFATSVAIDGLDGGGAFRERSAINSAVKRKDRKLERHGNGQNKPKDWANRYAQM
jgi:hypothetical protein